MNKSDITKQEEALLAIELWRESGLSQGAFCRQENIARTTFQHWRRRYDPSYDYKGKDEKSSVFENDSFISVEMQSVESDSHSVIKSEDLEIVYKNDVRIKCSSNISLLFLEKLINLQPD